MDIGGHCAFLTCNRLDFLPIKCRFCLRDFCEEHMTPERHDCPNLPQSSITSKSVQIETITCSVKDCKTPKGAMIVCDKCNKHFCLPCRLPESHRYGNYTAKIDLTFTQL